jgi:membrane-associated phospholipid phosphatase
MKTSFISFLILFIQLQSLIIAGTSRHDTSAVVNDSIIVSTMNKTSEYENSNELNTTWYQMFTQIPKDELLFFQTNIQLSNVPTYIGLTALTGSLMKVDQSGWKIDRRLYIKSGIYKTASDLSVDMGNGGFHLLLSGLFASYGLILNDPVALKTSSNIAESVLATGLLVQAIKHVTGRESPAYASNTRWKWQFFPSVKEYQKNQTKYYSFPSGHLASATATLTVIANNYPQFIWLKPVGYSVLGLLGMGLVSKGMHWYSDLPVGFFIGYSMGNIITPELIPQIVKNNYSPDSQQLSLSPGLYNKKLGLHVAYSF